MSEKKNLKDIKLRLRELKSKLLIMEWDYKRNQLNSGKKAIYEKLKEEFEELKKLEEHEGNKSND